METVITPSKRKLEKEGFNDMQDKKWFDTWFEIKKLKLNYVDLDKEQHPYWQNDNATLVLLVKNIKDALLIGELAVESLADEFQTVHASFASGNEVVRLWWD